MRPGWGTGKRRRRAGQWAGATAEQKRLQRAAARQSADDAGRDTDTDGRAGLAPTILRETDHRDSPMTRQEAQSWICCDAHAAFHHTCRPGRRAAPSRRRHCVWCVAPCSTLPLPCSTPCKYRVLNADQCHSQNHTCLRWRQRHGRAAAGRAVRLDGAQWLHV